MSLFSSKGFPYHRGRRLRSSNYIRDLVSENHLTADDLVMPYFIREDNDDPLIIANSDQYIDWNSSKALYDFNSKKLDGAILTFEAIHLESKSYQTQQHIIAHEIILICFVNRNFSSFKHLLSRLHFKHEITTLSFVCPIALSNLSKVHCFSSRLFSHRPTNFAT